MLKYCDENFRLRPIKLAYFMVYFLASISRYYVAGGVLALFAYLF